MTGFVEELLNNFLSHLSFNKNAYSLVVMVCTEELSLTTDQLTIIKITNNDYYIAFLFF